MWRELRGYEGLYEVSNLGEVKSLRSGRNLTKCEQVGGYFRVKVSKRGKAKSILVHRAVLEAFVGPCPEGMETRHLDGNPKNNRLDNLVWGTSQQNKLDTARQGNHPNQQKIQCPRGHLLQEPNIYSNTKSRRCKACHRAWNYAKYHNVPFHEPYILELADSNYYDIMHEDIVRVQHELTKERQDV